MCSTFFVLKIIASSASDASFTLGAPDLGSMVVSDLIILSIVLLSGSLTGALVSDTTSFTSLAFLLLLKLF